MQFFLAEWRGPFPENVPLTLGHLRRELGLPEAMVAREEDGGLLLLSSRNPTLTEERLTQALRRALPLPGDSPEQVSILKDLHACKTFLMYVSGLAETPQKIGDILKEISKNPALIPAAIIKSPKEIEDIFKKATRSRNVKRDN